MADQPKSDSASSETRPEGFENKLAELESLVEQLESGELELADSLQRFQRGVELSRECRRMLDEAQQTVEQVMREDDESSADPEPGETSD